MEPIATAAAIGGFIIPFLNILFQKFLAEIIEKWPVSDVVVGNLKVIGMTVLKIQAAVNQIEARELHDRRLVLWLKDLKDAAYEADDLLDEVATDLQVSKSTSTISLDSELAKRIGRMVEILARVAKGLGDFKLGELDDKLNHPFEIPKSQLTSSLIGELKIIGRDEDKEKIVNLLTSYNEFLDNNAFVLPVVGLGGIGKTSLVQLVYNDDAIKTYFHKRMWVCVSNIFDARRITEELIDSTNPDGKPCKTSNWNMLQTILKERLESEMFLLVLDDVWTDDQLQWGKLLAAFVGKKEGSKIIVTTRSPCVTKLQGMMSPYILKDLSMEYCRSLAIDELKQESSLKSEAVDVEVAAKMAGSPLAGKTLARLLNSEILENNRKRILGAEIWELQQNDGDIMPTLKRSYNYLPSHLKQCFAICSLFPKGHQYDKSDLVMMWMAQGFIYSADRKGMEDIGSKYFDDLISRGILNHEEGNYVMPALMNDLARYISVGECSRIESGRSWEFCGSIRHLSLSCANANMQELIKSGNLKGLRTLVLLDMQDASLDNVLEKLIENMQSLRVLDLRNNKIRELPESIKMLKHLRYLNLSNNLIQKLPSSLCELQNLQILVLLRCKDLSELPKDICKLSNLRHLKTDKQLRPESHKSGGFTFLPKLVEFKIDRNNKIGALKGMTQLHGHFSIQGIENVKNGNEAQEAMLTTKSHIRTLVLKWSKGPASDSKLYLEVLDNLQPHSELTELSILCYGGISSPRWMKSEMLPHLEVLRLCDCPRWQQLPTLGNLRLLKILEIRGMCRMVDLNFYGGTEKENFPSLRELHLSDMEGCTNWSAASRKPSFCRLANLVIRNCSKLAEMPKECFQDFTSLNNLELEDCPQLSLTSESSIPSSMKNLTIKSCPSVLNKQVCMALKNRDSHLSFKISNGYQNFKSFSTKVLPNVTQFHSLQICYRDELPPFASSCDIGMEYESKPQDGQQFLSLDISIKRNCSSSSINSGISKWLKNLTSPSTLTTSGGSEVQFLFLSIKVLQGSTVLSKLTLKNCEQLQPLGSQSLSSLNSLEIEGCPHLFDSSPTGSTSSSRANREIINSLPFTDFLQRLYSIEILNISSCPMLKNFEGATKALGTLSGLQDLRIKNCCELESLPANLSSMSLKSLYISGCKCLSTLPQGGVPSTLEELYIKGCPKLRAQCENGGADCQKIAHVKKVTLVVDSENHSPIV